MFRLIRADSWTEFVRFFVENSTVHEDVAIGLIITNPMVMTIDGRSV